MELIEVVSKFQGAKKIGDKSYQCRCSSHRDDKASLTITEKDNKILMHCHAGCDTRSILNAVGLTERDLFNNIKEKTRVVEEYIYRDENGNPLYKVMRFEPKNFIQAKYDNGNWVFKMAGVKYVLYNLPNVIKAEEVYFVEGEKDADNLNKIGLVATTTVSGASSYSKRAEEYTKYLKDKTVFIIPDNDKSGYKYAENVRKSLLDFAKEIKILKITEEIPDLKEKGDISDVIEEYGKEKTLEIIETLKEKNYGNISFPMQNTDDLNTEHFQFKTFDIKTLSKDDLLDKSVFNYLLTIEDEFECQKIISELEIRAKELNCLHTLKNLLKLYKQKIKKISKSEDLQHNDVAEMILQENSLAIYENNVYIYVNGFYNMDKKSIERKIVSLKPSASSNFRKEVYSYLELKDDIHMNIDKESGIINFKNGLYNIKERKLYEHTPDFFSINQIHINFNENAKVVSEIDDFLDKISNYNIKRKQTLLEIIGYSMTTSMKFQKVFILYGETARNGKSTFGSVITKLIGTENVGNVSFQDICTNRFASSGIKGKLLDLGSEMTEEFIKDISLFKALASGDDVEIERKFENRHTISPYAKFIFNANTLPQVADQTNGFYRRLHIIPFEKSFSDDEVKRFDINKILTNEALEYLAKISLDAYVSMDEQFSNYEESELEVNKYKMASNSVLGFVGDKENLNSFYDNKIHMGNKVHRCYKDYCEDNQLKWIGLQKFYKEIEKTGIVIEKKINNQKAYIFRNIKNPKLK